ARARVVLRLAGRRPDRRENGLTRLVQSASWKAPRPCSPPSTSRPVPNRPARLRASGTSTTGRCCAESARSAGSSVPRATAGPAGRAAGRGAYSARRGEAVEGKTYAYDEPAVLTARLGAAGFAPEDTETVVVALTADVAAEPVLPPGVVVRQVTADADMRRI